MCMYNFLVKGVKSLTSSHLDSPMKNIGWFDSNSVKYICPANWSTDAYSSLFVTIDYTLDFVGHPIFLASY